MCALNVCGLADDLRALADSAKHRLWIASPYIGSWKAVKRIIGVAWQKVDVKLLIDKESGILAQDTIEQFAKHRPVQSLKGLHAKVYIVDDSVLLTSANLTETAFTRRYEAGLMLKGEQARKLVELYEDLWGRGEQVDVKSIPFTKCRRGDVDEPHPGTLPRLYELPRAPEASSKGAGAFADYPYFLDIYREFADTYVRCGGRDHPEQPLYFETDKFLNFLFHDHPDTPSKAYKDKPCRPLSDGKRMDEIKAYRDYYRRLGLKGEDHSETAKVVQEFLAKSRIIQITSDQIASLAGRLNCFWVLPIAKAKFLNNNDEQSIQKSWFDLIHGSDEVKLRMNNCAATLFGFGKSAIQETLGYYDPEHFPLRNVNTNAGLRFLGYDVKN
jgi:hypothetical protein